MATYTESDLVEDIRHALQNPDHLKRTREIVGEDILKDSRLQNWIRANRKLPELLLIGASLMFSAHEEEIMGTRSASRIGMWAKKFWLLFVVQEPQPPSAPTADCIAIRYWEKVRRVGNEKDKDLYLNSTVWSNGFPSEDNPIWNAVSGEEFPRVENEDEDQDGWKKMKPDRDNAGDKVSEISLTWRVPPGEGILDYGCVMRWADTVRRKRTKENRYEYLGGRAGVPADSETIIAIIPNTLLAKSRNPLDKERPIPWCLGFHQDDPIQTLEQFLEGKSGQRRFSSWVDTNPGSVQFCKESQITLPENIRKRLTDADVLSDDEISLWSKPDYSCFAVTIEHPEPLLHYCLFFELGDGDA